MKIFAAEIIREIDKYTIEHEPVESIDLMERAANMMFLTFRLMYSQSYKIAVFCGPGNNGGDGLALARILHHAGYSLACYLACSPDKLSPDAAINYNRLLTLMPVTELSSDTLPALAANTLVIDAIFGSGLKRRAEGLYADLIRHINASPAEVVSVDIPSGLFSEHNPDNPSENIICADHTLTLQMPKLSFMFADTGKYAGEVHIIPIGLHSKALEEFQSLGEYLDGEMVSRLIKPRPKFGHKGTFGKALIVAGSRGMAGAAVLCARACYRSGAGLVKVHVPSSCADILQISVPEAIVDTDEDANIFTGVDVLGYNAIAVGCGIGKSAKTAQALKRLLLDASAPLILDADALNIISQNTELLALVPKHSILTPHRKEFERLLNEEIYSDYQLFRRQQEFSAKHQLIMVLKGAHTSITLSDGTTLFNSTGNPGMATGGSGDVLTGIICGLLAQGYTPQDAAAIGVYIHGFAGDRAAAQRDETAIMASDITENITFTITNTLET
jgi:NAD(P)H-hydrate epimerase